MLGTGADLKRSSVAGWMINIVCHKTSYFSMGGAPCILENSQWLSLKFARLISWHSWNGTYRYCVVILQKPIRGGGMISVPLTIWSPKSIIYSICYGNEGASSSVYDVDPYVIIKQLLDSYIHKPVRNSNILAQDFSSVSLPTQGMT
jgi:hypothetical protein